MDLVIRPYGPGDAGEITRLFYAAVHTVTLSDYTEEQVHAWAPEVPEERPWHRRMSARHTLVAEAEEAVVAFAELEDDGHLDMFYCHPDHVRCGVGTALYAAVELKATELGLDRVFTEASITARPFFEKLGFRTIRKRNVTVRGVSMTNFAMEKDLSVGWWITPRSSGTP